MRIRGVGESVVVFKVHVQDLVIVDAEGEAPITGNVEAPNGFSVSGELVGSPGGECIELFRMAHILQKGKHGSELFHGIGWKSPGGIVHVKAFQAFVGKAPKDH